jgi:hypothetical protein
MEAEMDLSAYPPTLKGTRDIVRASAARIEALWRSGRERYKTDDLVIIIDGKTNSLRINTRATVCEQFRRHDPRSKLLADIERVAPAAAGAIALWCVMGFLEGPVFIALAVVVRS